MRDEKGRLVSVCTLIMHMKWTWAVALGYAAGIWVHLLLHDMWKNECVAAVQAAATRLQIVPAISEPAKAKLR